MMIKKIDIFQSLEGLNKGKRSKDTYFQDCYNNYIEDISHKIRLTTLNTKECIFNKNILPYFVDLKLSEITASHIQVWQNYLYNNSDYKPTYLRTIHNNMTSLWSYICKYYDIESNPSKICGAMGECYSHIESFWELKDFNKFIKNIENEHFQLAFKMLYYLGLRIGELLALTPKDFNRKKNIIYIRKSYTRLKKKDLFLEPKTHSSKRVLTIPKFLSMDLRRIIKSHNISKNNRIFYMSRYQITERLKKIIDYEGLPYIRIHDLRHSNASLLSNLKISNKAISNRLGHSSITTTNSIYTHVYEKIDNEIANKLDEIYKKNNV